MTDMAERWRGKVAVVTGASTGIGAVLSEKLVSQGMKVAGLSRRFDRLESARERMSHLTGSFHPIECDLLIEADILSAFKKIEEEIGPVSVLVNNAAVIFAESIAAGKSSNFQEILNVNLLAVAICSREAIQSMLKHRVVGHIINISSISGHSSAKVSTPVSLYCASKRAVLGLCDDLRNELHGKEPPIKVSSISPGTVRSDMIRLGFGIPQDIFESAPFLEPENVADAIVYIINSPPHVQINDLILKNVREP